jgi:ADP-heptose:LPS heptosyltransferase
MLRPKVLFARADNAGDVLLSGPAVRAVARHAGSLTFLSGPWGSEAASLLPGVDRVVSAHLQWIDPEPAPCDRRRLFELVDRLCALEVDEAVISTSHHQSALPLALVLRMAGVSCISAISADYAGSLLDTRVLVEDDIHEVARAMTLVAAAGFPPDPEDDLRLAVLAPTRSRALGAAGGYVVLHPGASVAARAWSVQNMTALCRALTSEGRDVVVTGGRSERSLTSRVASGRRQGSPGKVVDLGGNTDLRELAAVVAGASVIVAGNTGPAHLAAAVGTPVVSLYAPTVPATRWHPWMVPHVVLGDQAIACAGCRARICPVAGHPCIDAVEVSSVVSAVEKLESLRLDDEAHERAMGVA